MIEESGQALADGWWCSNCEMFEQDDQINTTVEACELCGCVGSWHLSVEVVAR